MSCKDPGADKLIRPPVALPQAAPLIIGRKKRTCGIFRKSFDFFVEPLSRIELLTSSLPRMHSTD